MIIEQAIARWALGLPPAVAEKQVLPAEALARYQGMYRPERGGDGFRVFVRDGSLFIQNTDGAGEERLYAQGDHTFRLESAPTLDWVFDVPRSRAETLAIRGGTFIRIYRRVVEPR